MGPYQVLPYWARVDLGVIGYEKDTQHSPKLQYYQILTIRLFSVISRTFVGGNLPLCRDAVGLFFSSSWLGHNNNLQVNYNKNKNITNLSKLVHCWDWPEYWEEFWRLEETWCHSDSSERPLSNVNVRNSR